MGARAADRGAGAGRVVELFAGVGGFRLGLEPDWQVVWANQWEPATKRQHAYEVYRRRFGDGDIVCADIATVVDEVPDHDLLVGGFPCQDYSVARTLNQAAGLRGKKGVLWWSINEILEKRRPPFVLLENVDRLLKSPASQRGRDFAVILSCFAQLGYVVEWRVVNAADYGFPQRRRRVFIAARLPSDGMDESGEAERWLLQDGVFARALPAKASSEPLLAEPLIVGVDPIEVSERFGIGWPISPFRSGGLMWNGHVWTQDVLPVWKGKRSTLRDVVLPEEGVPGRFFIPPEQLPRWEYLKGAKMEERVHKASGQPYMYAEGGIAFPDPVDRPSRTILTGEGGATPSRFKHVVVTPSGQYRRLTPVELEVLNGFPPGWTDITMPDGRPIPDGRRAFLMGNALVIGIVERIGRVLSAARSLLGAADPVGSRGP